MVRAEVNRVSMDGRGVDARVASSSQNAPFPICQFPALLPRSVPPMSFPDSRTTNWLIVRRYRPEDVPAYYDLCRANREHLLSEEAGSPALAGLHLESIGPRPGQVAAGVP